MSRQRITPENLDIAITDIVERQRRQAEEQAKEARIRAVADAKIEALRKSYEAVDAQMLRIMEQAGQEEYGWDRPGYTPDSLLSERAKQNYPNKSSRLIPLFEATPNALGLTHTGARIRRREAEFGERSVDRTTFSIAYFAYEPISGREQDLYGDFLYPLEEALEGPDSQGSYYADNVERVAGLEEAGKFAEVDGFIAKLNQLETAAAAIPSLA